MKIEINRNLELVEILLYLADRQSRTVQVLENSYYSSKIDEYFEKYKSHTAVALTQKMIDEQNFIHIKPIRAILSLNKILSDNTNRLYEWATEVIDFVVVSHFDDFIFTMSSYYNMIIKKGEDFNIQKCINFTRDYFKGSNEPFCLLICPFAGNYGFVLDGVSYVVRCLPYDENGNINVAYTNHLIGGIAHEYAHCFVNPVIEKYKDKLYEYEDFFAAHKSMYTAYNVNYAVMNEYFAISFTVRYRQIFRNDFPDYDEYCKNIETTKKVFIYLDKFIDFLIEYEQSNLTFEEFYLKILHRIGDMK
ncbi:MAG: DUF4932 domain-containing protein [Eubacteriales bacterium]|nr:DUF4932 domain-containing protein [Eubacteriales bacterium]